MKIVFIHSKHQHIWFHVFLFCVKPYTLSHYAFEKKVKKIFSKKKKFFFGIFFSKITLWWPNEDLRPLKKKIFFKKFLFNIVDFFSNV